MDLPDLVDDEGMMEDPHHEDENGDYEVEGIAWDDDESDEEVGEDNILLGPVKCLFCDRVLNSAQEVFAHSQSDHSFQIHSFCRKWSLDCLGYIRLINFIRLQLPHVDKLNSLHPRDGPAPWDNDKFMVPTDAEDLLLQYDIESDLSLASDKPEPPESKDQGDGAAEMDQDVTVRAKDLHALIVQKDEALSKVAILEAELQRALHDLECIRRTAQGLIAGEGKVWVPQKRLSEGVAIDDWDSGDKEAGEAGEEACCSGMGAIQRLSLKEDEAYFSSYSDFNIHAEMLQDKVRTESYRDFIFANAEVFRDKVVLDVGCGTGILSMFAARAGAKHVIGVDMSDIIYRAMGIARENDLEEKITFLKGKMEDVKLPYEKVDVIISEWMGYFLLFESMLDTVIVARNNYLRPGGCVYPDKCSLWLAGFCDTKLMDKFINFWDDVYGFKMTCMKSEVVNQTSVDIINKDCIITEPCKIKELDLAKCSLSDVDFTSNFTLTVCRDGEMHGFVGYFDIGFELGCSKPLYFSTGPDCPSTHWKQTQFLLKTPISLLKGAKLEGCIKVKKNRKDPRSLDVTITLDGRTQEYIIE